MFHGIKYLYLETKAKHYYTISFLCFSIFPQLNKEKLLGVTAVYSSSGINQVKGILPLVEKSGQHFCYKFDSTDSNTGIRAGSASLLQDYKNLICGSYVVTM